MPNARALHHDVCVASLRRQFAKIVWPALGQKVCALDLCQWWVPSRLCFPLGLPQCSITNSTEEAPASSSPPAGGG